MANNFEFGLEIGDMFSEPESRLRPYPMYGVVCSMDSDGIGIHTIRDRDRLKIEEIAKEIRKYWRLSGSLDEDGL